MNKTFKRSVIGLIVVAAAMLLIGTACNLGGGGGGGDGDLLYITDTFSGDVFTYNLDSQTASGSIFSIGEGAGDWIGFYDDIGYVCVGSTGFNNPGVYWFDPSAAVPVATRIGAAISAGAIAFYDDTKAYVIDRDKNFVSGDIISVGVYTFNPSNPAAGLAGPIPGTDNTGAGGQYLLGITLGTDGNIYVSDGDNGQVLQITTSGPNEDTVTDSWNTSATGTTGLLAKTSGMTGKDILYVANSGGTIDIINITDDTISTAVTGSTATQIVFHAGTSSYYCAAWDKVTVFTAGGPPPYAAIEVTDSGGGSVGGTMCLVGDLLFVTNTDYFSYSRLVVFDAGTATEMSYSPVDVGTQGVDAVTGITLFED
jgi:hypothetical protein